MEETGLSLTPCEMEMAPLPFAEEVLKSHNHIMILQYCSQSMETLHSIVLSPHVNPFVTFPNTNIYFNLCHFNKC